MSNDRATYVTPYNVAVDVTLDKALRIRCLELAVDTMSVGDPVETAARMERFILGEPKTEASDAED